MATLNPPRVLPGLGRSIVNFVLESRKDWDEDGLAAAFNPGVNTGPGANEPIMNTLSALRAIGIMSTDSDGKLRLAPHLQESAKAYDRAAFRRLLQEQVLDLRRDGDPWSIEEGEAATSGARDLTRALSWFLAQDALGPPLSWTDNVQQLQKAQFKTGHLDEWVLRNDSRWGAFTRWALALGFAVPSPVRGKPGLIPLPTVAVADALSTMPPERMSMTDFLELLSDQLPVFPGGTLREGLISRLGSDPDPGTRANAADSSVSQVLRILESRGIITLESLADADGVLLVDSDRARTTHITLRGGKKR